MWNLLFKNANNDSAHPHRPNDNRFSQQRLYVCQPLITAGTALPYFKVLTLLYLLLALVSFYGNEQVIEYRYDYTDCVDHHTQKFCSDMRRGSFETNCTCEVHVNITQNIPRNVFIYYSIENFYQNSMVYVQSIDYLQLSGRAKMTSDHFYCKTFSKAWEPVEDKFKPIAPCGMVANSIFNDTFTLEKFIYSPDGQKTYLYNVAINRTQISWKYKKMFRNPHPNKNCSNLRCLFEETVKPPNWKFPVWYLDPQRPENNGFVNEPLKVWMRTSPFSTFRKLYGRVEHNDDILFIEGLPKGRYIFKIQYNYPVSMFGGKKYIIISNTSWLGGSNFFLTYLLGGTSIVCTILIIFFHLIDRRYGKISYKVHSFVKKTTEFEVRRRK